MQKIVIVTLLLILTGISGCLDKGSKTTETTADDSWKEPVFDDLDEFNDTDDNTYQDTNTGSNDSTDNSDNTNSSGATGNDSNTDSNQSQDDSTNSNQGSDAEAQWDSQVLLVAPEEINQGEETTITMHHATRSTNADENDVVPSIILTYTVETVDGTLSTKNPYQTGDDAQCNWNSTDNKLQLRCTFTKPIAFKEYQADMKFTIESAISDTITITAMIQQEGDIKPSNNEVSKIVNFIPTQTASTGGGNNGGSGDGGSGNNNQAPQTSLQMISTAHTSSVVQYQSAQYTYVLNNTGNYAAQSVTLSIPLTNLSPLHGQVGNNNNICSVVNSKYTCQVGTILAGQEKTVNVWLKPTTTGSFHVTSTVSSSTELTSTPQKTFTLTVNNQPNTARNTMTHIVNITDGQFTPIVITAQLGDFIEFQHNDGSSTHKIIGQNIADMNSGDINTGDSYTYGAGDSVDIYYRCEYHGNMIGVINVINNAP